MMIREKVDIPDVPKSHSRNVNAFIRATLMASALKQRLMYHNLRAGSLGMRLTGGQRAEAGRLIANVPGGYPEESERPCDT